MATTKLYSNLHLITLDSYVILQPYDVEDPYSIFIDRATFKIEMRHWQKAIFTGTVRSSVKVHGCLGIINLLSGPHLICISEKATIGSIRHDQVIHKVTKTLITPISLAPIPLTEDEKKEEKNYLNILTELLESFDFYYSYDFDVTHSEQRASDIDSNPDLKNLPLWKRADRRFFWNYHLQKIFIDNEFHPFILPTMDGFIRITECEINYNVFKYVFISRRSCKRTGARYHMRGADPLGNVANFVETEQIVVFDQVLTSFVQTRGSIPLIWQQKGKEMKPKPIVVNSTQSDDAFQSHVQELLLLYGPQVFVSLIDQTGIEVPVGDRFETYAHLFGGNRVRYVAFDFHERCKNNKYENLSELLDKVKSQLDSYGYLFKSTNSPPSLIQSGSFRTNCIDCLDRTNVVQSVFAHHVLHSQLTRMGIISQNEKIESHQTFESQFKHIWADNADVMSEQYTGTVALKTDYTRFGKRSVKGTMTDGMNSVRRYLNKNFKDDDKQLAIDLLLGKYVLEKFDPSLITMSTLDNSINNNNNSNRTSPIQVSPSLNSQQQQEEQQPMIETKEPNIVHEATEQEKEKEKQGTDINNNNNTNNNNNNDELESINSDSSEIRIGTELLEYDIVIIPDGDTTKSVLPANLIVTPGSIITITKVSGRKKEIPFFSITLLEKSRLNHRQLNLYHKESPEPEYIQFSSSLLREQFMKCLYRRNLSNCYQPSLKEKTGSNNLLEMYDCFVGSWNMENININSTILAEWIPKDRGLYSISAQRVASDNRPSPGFVMNYKQYWFYLIRQYLGPDYVCVATATSTSTASIVLIRKSLANSVSNINVTHLLKRTPSKKGSGSTPSSSSSSQTTSTTSSSSSSSTSQSTSFFGVFKLKDVGNKIMEGTGGSTKYKDKQYGTAISFLICETTVCFVNYCNGNVTGRMDTQEDGGIVYCKNRQYINGSNRYVFWSGDYDPVTLKNIGWNEFIGQNDPSNELHGRGVIYWRTLKQAHPLPKGDDSYQTPHAQSNAGCLFPPISATTSVPVLTPYSWLNPAEIPCFIVLKNLLASEFEYLAPNTKVEAHLEFNAAHLLIDEGDSTMVGGGNNTVSGSSSSGGGNSSGGSSTGINSSSNPNANSSDSIGGANGSVRTSTNRSTIPLVGWNDVVELKSFIDDKQYLSTLYLQVALFDISKGFLGKGSIPLRDAINNSYHFKVRLYAYDEPSCYLQGDIQIFSKSEITKMVEMQASALISASPVFKSQKSPNETPSSRSPLLSFIPFVSGSSPSISPPPQPIVTTTTTTSITTATTINTTSTVVSSSISSDSLLPTQPISPSTPTNTSNTVQIDNEIVGAPLNMTPTKTTASSFLGGITKMVDNFSEKVSSDLINAFKPFSVSNSPTVPSPSSTLEEIETSPPQQQTSLTSSIDKAKSPSTHTVPIQSDNESNTTPKEEQDSINDS